jgi:flagellar hook-length control protein FliK
MDEWNTSEGQLVSARITELQEERDVARQALEGARTEAAAATAAALEDLRTERSRLQDDLMQALETDRQAQTASVELGAAIETQQQRVAHLAGESVIYDIAAKVYGVALHEVSEEQANITTFWVVLGVGLAAALSTSLAAFMAAYLKTQKRTAGHIRAVRLAKAKSRRIASRDKMIDALRKDLEAEKQKPPKIEYRERVVYRHLPIDRDLMVEARGQLRPVMTEVSDAA